MSRMVYVASSGVKISPQIADESVWVSAQDIAAMLNVGYKNVVYHAKNLKNAGLLDGDDVLRIFPVTKSEKGRDVTRQVRHYSPKGVYLFAMRMNSAAAYDFQMWAADVLHKLKRDGVVHANPQPQLPDHSEELAELKGEVAQLRTENKQLQGIIDECLTDMNEGRVPWFGGALPKRVTYLIGAQKGARPQAPQLADRMVVNNVLTVAAMPETTTDKGRVLGYIAHHLKQTGIPATASDVRTRTGRSTAVRMKLAQVQEIIDELEKEGVIEGVRIEGGRVKRWRVK